MVDTSVKSIGVDMVKMDMNTYPRYEMPEGFYITGYREGDEYHWADIAKEQFVLESVDLGLESFKKDFFAQTERWERLKDSCLFAIEEKTGEVAAVLTLWEGGILEGNHRRIHWVATREKFQGKGIIKAMMTYAMDLYHKQGSKGPCVLATGTQNWQAIRIYKKFGFEPFHGPEYRPVGDRILEEKPECWQIIDDKIAEFEAKRG